MISKLSKGSSYLALRASVKRSSVSYGVVRTLTQLKDDPSEYTERAEYPDVFDASKEGLKIRARNLWAQEIQKLPTVEQKLWEITRQKFFGYFTHELDSWNIPHLGYPYIRKITATRMIEGDLPLPALKQEDLLTQLVTELKPVISELYQLEYRCKSSHYEADISDREIAKYKTASLLCHLNRTLMSHLQPFSPILESLQVDHSPHVAAYWFHHKMRTPLHDIFIRIRNPRDRQPPIRHRTSPFQYLGNSCLMQLRGENPLDCSELPSVDMTGPEDSLNEALPISGLDLDPNELVDPRVFGFKAQMRHLAMVPGFLKSGIQGDPNEFPLLQFHHYCPVGTDNFPIDHFTPEDHQKLIHAQGILCGYGNLTATAAYQGFTPYNDITYPLSCQTVLTDGLKWSFYVYLMYSNTVGLRNNLNSDVNVCWGTPSMSLFEPHDVDFSNPNEDCLKLIISMYLLSLDTNMSSAILRPYLDSEHPSLTDHPGIADRDKILAQLRRTTANIQEHPFKRPEIYSWEKIYKIKFNTRPMDRPDRYFEKRESLNVKFGEKAVRL